MTAPDQPLISAPALEARAESRPWASGGSIDGEPVPAAERPPASVRQPGLDPSYYYASPTARPAAGEPALELAEVPPLGPVGYAGAEPGPPLDSPPLEVAVETSRIVPDLPREGEILAPAGFEPWTGDETRAVAGGLVAQSPEENAAIGAPLAREQRPREEPVPVAAAWTPGARFAVTLAHSPGVEWSSGRGHDAPSEDRRGEPAAAAPWWISGRSDGPSLAGGLGGWVRSSGRARFYSESPSMSHPAPASPSGGGRRR